MEIKSRNEGVREGQTERGRVKEGWLKRRRKVDKEKNRHGVDRKKKG